MMARYCARLVLLGTLAIMLSPRQFLGGIDLEQRAVEGGAFGLCTALWVFMNAERLRRLHRLNTAALITCLPGVALELSAVAAVAEAGQLLLGRHAAFDHFLSNTVIIVVVAAICALIAIFLAMPSHQRLGRRVFGD